MKSIKIDTKPPRVRAFLEGLLRAGLEAADPADAVRRTVRRHGPRLQVGTARYDLRRHARIIAVGAGKASGAMAAELEQILGNDLHGGVVVVPYGLRRRMRAIAVLEAGHPLPDQAGRRAAQQVLAVVQTLSRHDLLFVLLSGGASSLLPAPSPPVTLAEKRRTTQLLLRCGATIQETNTVRKHLSSLKGGRLAAATSAHIISLILSDVIGDDFGTIASGPTAPDPTAYADAYAVLRRYGLWEAIPARARGCLAAGMRGARAETPKPGAPVFRRVQNEIVGNNATAVAAVARTATRSRFQPFVLSTSFIGEAREAAKIFGAIAREIVSYGRPVARPACVIAGGELTVTVRGRGLGGRGQEFALAAAIEIANVPAVWIAAIGTDGTDGPTDVAGAVVNGETVTRAKRLGVDLTEALRRNDAYRFFKKVGGHISTGRTGTNVNDLYLLIAP